MCLIRHGFSNLFQNWFILPLISPKQNRFLVRKKSETILQSGFSWFFVCLHRISFQTVLAKQTEIIFLFCLYFSINYLIRNWNSDLKQFRETVPWCATIYYGTAPWNFFHTPKYETRRKFPWNKRPRISYNLLNMNKKIKKVKKCLKKSSTPLFKSVYISSHKKKRTFSWLKLLKNKNNGKNILEHPVNHLIRRIKCIVIGSHICNFYCRYFKKYK